MAVPQPPAARKGPSSAWSRLKTPVIDPLEVYGLPSKGETRLNDPKAQEEYYNKIVERYMKFCSDAGRGDQLDKQFAALSISGRSTSLSLSKPKEGSTPVSLSAAEATASGGLASSRYASTPSKVTTPEPPRPLLSVPADDAKAGLQSRASTNELQLILSAMRKLRESVTATHRHDTFAQRCYIFIIRACILTKSWESYHPALLYLLGTIHSCTPLGQSELREFVGYRVLDEACRVGDLAEAQRVRILWNRHTGGKAVDVRLETILGALVHENWHQFWRVRRAVDGYLRALMSWAEEGMTLHALKCVGRSYFTADKTYIEKSAGLDWASLSGMGVAWELQGDGKTVIIRRPKARTAGPAAPEH